MYDYEYIQHTIYYTGSFIYQYLFSEVVTYLNISYLCSLNKAVFYYKKCLLLTISTKTFITFSRVYVALVTIILQEMKKNITMTTVILTKMHIIDLWLNTKMYIYIYVYSYY